MRMKVEVVIYEKCVPKYFLYEAMEKGNET